MRSIEALRYGGRVVGYGLSSTMLDNHSAPDVEATLSQPFSLSPLINESVGFIGCHLGAPALLFRKWMNQLIDLCDHGRISPHIDRVFPFEEAADAHRYIHERRNVGKILLRP